jgi:hypothetical protein
MVPSHDCSNTFGGQPVLRVPQGNTPAPGGPSAYAACTIARNFPSLFGGGKIPEVLPDQQRPPSGRDLLAKRSRD